MKIISKSRLMKVKQSTSASVNIKNRRIGDDAYTYFSPVLACISWLLFLCAVVFSYYVMPDSSYGVLRYYNIDTEQQWDVQLVGYLFTLIWLSALGSFIALMFDKYRSRRKNDKPHYNAVLLLFINLIWLVYILYHLIILLN